MNEISKMDNRKAPEYTAASPAVLNINEIYKILPHRYPFALVDKVVSLEEDSIVSIKNVSINEPFFVGHFPDNPVMPGVLQVEAMAQTGGLLMIKKVEKPSDYWTYFLGIENCKFRKMVLPGHTLVIRCTTKGPIRRNMVKLSGQVFVEGKLACEAVLTAMIIEKDSVKNNSGY